MTIKKYLDGLKKQGFIGPDGKSLSDAMQETVEIWSNDACMGYCVAAMQAAGYGKTQITQVLREMGGLFDSCTLSEAEQEYINF